MDRSPRLAKSTKKQNPLDTPDDIEELLNQKADIQDIQDLFAIKTNK